MLQTRNDVMLIAGHRGNWIRLRTLVLLRWVAVAGQIAAVLVAAVLFRLDLALGPCLALIALSALANLAAMMVFPENTRLSERQMTLMLMFDTVQLLGLIALTGGLNNPFALLLLGPVTISATALSIGPTLLIGGTAIVLMTLSALFHVDLRGPNGEPLEMPALFILGFWSALVVGVLFLAGYARRVAIESAAMAEALLATQMALAREQKLTDLGGVVAAAAHELGTPLATIKLASVELADELSDRPELAEDALLIREQADRCRDILRDMGRSVKPDAYVTRAPIETVVREAAEPHMGRGKVVEILLGEGQDEADQPFVMRRPEIIHGLRNLIQNAVDYAASEVTIDIDWDEDSVRIRIADDGPGYPLGQIGRLGDPFLKNRDAPDPARPEYYGMGLGLFIAKTLLGRTGAEIEFANGQVDPEGGGGGAIATVQWPADAEVFVAAAETKGRLQGAAG